MPTINFAESSSPLDLPIAAAQYFNQSARVSMGASLLVSTVAFIVMCLYMRAIFRESQRSTSLLQTDPEVKDNTHPSLLAAQGQLEILIEKPSDGLNNPSSWNSTIFQHAETAFRRAACVYTLGGSVHAATSTGLLFLFGIYSLPNTPSWLTIMACYIAVFWSWSFMTLVTLALFWGPNHRFRWLLVLGYIGMLLAIGALLKLGGAPPLPFADVGLMPKNEAKLLLSFASKMMGQQVSAEEVAFSPHLQPILFWGLSTAPVIIPFITFNRFIRATVGPLFVNLALLMMLSTFFIIDLVLYIPPGVWFVSHIKRFFADSTFEVLAAINLTVSAVVAWCGLLWIARRYQRKQLSDQTFLLDALWLSASFFVSVFLMGVNGNFLYLLGLLPFVLYKITVRYGLKRLGVSAERMPKVHLLFLRVFGSPSRSEKLFDYLAARWRYAGSIQLIGAMDMARSRFEPDEFLDFLNGKLANTYINAGTDLNRHLAELDLRSDPDGRYRINEFFCRADTWKQTVTRLMIQSDLVVMDLRAFTSARIGCIFELGALIDDVPLQRIVLLIDQSTDKLLLRQTIADLWRKMNPESPNASSEIARIRIIDLSCGYPAAVRRLMQLGDETAACINATHTVSGRRM